MSSRQKQEEAAVVALQAIGLTDADISYRHPELRAAIDRLNEASVKKDTARTTPVRTGSAEIPAPPPLSSFPRP